MTTFKDLSAVRGTYTARDGSTKNRYINIGKEVTKDDGGRFLVINPLIKLELLPRNADGDVMVSIFEPKEQPNDTPQASQVSAEDYARVSGGSVKQGSMAAMLNDDIPFIYNWM